MKNFKRKVSGKKRGLNQSDDQKLKVAQSELISKKGLKRSRDETEETLQSSTKKMKLMNEFKESQINKLKPAIKQNLKSNKGFKEAANGQKFLSKGKSKKGKIVEQVEEESDEEMSGNESVDSGDDIQYSLNLSKKSDSSDDDDDINDSEDEGEDEGEDSDDEEEDDSNGEEMDDDDIVEAINKKAKVQPKKKVKNVDNSDEDNSGEDDDDNSDENDDSDNSDDDNDNSDEDSSDDSSDDEEDAESSSSSSSSEGEDEEFETVPWGELTADAPRTEDATSRLALCNMDWNHVKAVDIFVVLNSFTPVGGNIKNVKVYPSDFGLERMKIEEQEGPLKLIGQSKNENAQLINLRKYEMDKLKYYYAVITCDSVDTADAIYKACDGTEFLKSGVVIDLRFIPEDMTFDRKPTSVAKSMPLEGTYEPPDFENKALHCTDVSLTWDETPADRVNAFKCWDENLDLEEFEARLKDYIAPPSDEEEDEDDDENDDDEIRKPKKRPLQDTIALYRNLLKDIDDKEKEEEDEKREKEETEKKFLEALGGCTWLTQKSNSAKNDKKSNKEEDEEECEDDSGDDDDDDEEESGSEEEDEVDDDDEEEEEIKLPVKGKKISNRKLVKMKIKEKKKQKMSDKALPTTQADRFKKLMNNKDFALDEKVADKTTKLKQRRIFSNMKKKHGR